MNTLQSVKSTPESAHATLHSFFSTFEDDAAQQNLWYLLTECLKSDNDAISPIDRANMIFFYEHCVELFKATQILYADEAEMRMNDNDKGFEQQGY